MPRRSIKVTVEIKLRHCVSTTSSEASKGYYNSINSYWLLANYVNWHAAKRLLDFFRELFTTVPYFRTFELQTTVHTNWSARRHYSEAPPSIHLSLPSSLQCIALSAQDTKTCENYASAVGNQANMASCTKVYAEQVWDCCNWNSTSMNDQTPIFQDCQDAFDKGERKSGAVYVLRPDPSWKLVRAICQFDAESGWTVIQRRLDGSVDFYRGWSDYVDGFGYLDREYWIGLDAIYYLTRTNKKLSVYLEAHDGDSRTANFSTFYIDHADFDYSIHVGGYAGNAGDSLTHHNGKRFSTFDKDNDSYGDNCAIECEGAWWYRFCHRSNLNGRWIEGGNSPTRTGIIWYDYKTHDYSLRKVYMMLGR
ncbi:microfibril-associated glycoprotein 4-like [Watersipora subatra]|uniref:microfibril-associated glycoprotein 4-like n=1 Tax=Watersipora subatra TaxID=2589382 RepID=UPI00355C587C